MEIKPIRKNISDQEARTEKFVLKVREWQVYAQDLVFVFLHATSNLHLTRHEWKSDSCYRYWAWQYQGFMLSASP